MIISASRRTDIPAFFGPWFVGRLTTGFFHSVNPFNPSQIRAISLVPDDVDALVFWTKNPEPFTPALDVLDQRGYRYYFQYTLNDYPAALETHVPPLEKRIRAFKMLSRRIGPGRVIWRYDPIILSSITAPAYHIERFSRLAQNLEGASSRVTISFLCYYNKVKKRLRECSIRSGIVFPGLDDREDPEAMIDLAGRLADIATQYGFTMQSCAESHDLGSVGINPGACIDGDLIRHEFHLDRHFPKDTHQRSGCLCVKSVDMGMYDTCRHGCIYCYANNRPAVIAANRLKHDPDSAALLGKASDNPPILKESTDQKLFE